MDVERDFGPAYKQTRGKNLSFSTFIDLGDPPLTLTLTLTHAHAHTHSHMHQRKTHSIADEKGGKGGKAGRRKGADKYTHTLTHHHAHTTQNNRTL